MTRALLMLALFTGCLYPERPLSDGGVEYQLPDGGWVENGEGCGCDHFNDELLDPDGRLLLRCESTVKCDRGGCPTAVCYGYACCVWRDPRFSP